MTLREVFIAPLLALAIFFGVYPQALLTYMQPSVNKTVVELTEWTKTHHDIRPNQHNAGCPTIRFLIAATKYAVTFQSIINHLTNDTLQISLPLFGPS
jgi:hypothetical protein